MNHTPIARDRSDSKSRQLSTNSGIINANISPGTNNLQLQLGRAGASTNTGTIEASNGGVLVIGSTTINNVGGTIESTGANSNVSLVGSLGTSGLTISGGTYTTSDGGTIYGEGFTTLDGTTTPVVNSGTLVVPDVNQNTSGINIQGTFKNTNTVKVLIHGRSGFIVGSQRGDFHAHRNRQRSDGRWH